VSLGIIANLYLSLKFFIEFLFLRPLLVAADSVAIKFSISVKGYLINLKLYLKDFEIRQED
jgi:hypothetical protein